MRRVLTTLLSAFAVVALTALPALAAEKGFSVTGSSEGVQAGLIIGLIFGIAVTIYAYVGTSFGERPAHHEYAHDIREGVGGHAPHEEEVGTAVPTEEETTTSA